MGPRICAVVFLLLGLLQPVALGQRQQRDGALYRWGGEQWVQVDGYGVRVSVAPDGAAWVVNSQNEIYHFVNGRFDRLPGTATDIGVGGDGTAWIIGTDSNVYRWTHDNWERMLGTGVAISVDRSGSAWVVNAANEIYRWAGSAFERLPGMARDVGAETRYGSSAPTARFTVSTLASGPGAWPCVSALARTGRPGW